MIMNERFKEFTSLVGGFSPMRPKEVVYLAVKWGICVNEDPLRCCINMFVVDGACVGPPLGRGGCWIRVLLTGSGKARRMKNYKAYVVVPNLASTKRRLGSACWTVNVALPRTTGLPSGSVATGRVLWIHNSQPYKGALLCLAPEEKMW